MLSTSKSTILSPSTSVLSETEKSEEKKPEEIKPEVIKSEEKKPKITLIIKIDDDASASASVNIREKPTTDSEKIGQAKNGETFEFVSEDSKWYEVKLADGLTGFISAEFIEEKLMEEINE